jgi:tetratricopeptide (TPR) repeat protein
MGEGQGMSNELATESTANPTLKAAQVYIMAAICLAMGLAIGYIFRGSQNQTPPPQTTANSPSQVVVGSPKGKVPAGNQLPSAAGAALQSPHGRAMGGQMPTLDQMKQMADSKAAPLLVKLKRDPNNTDLLDQVGAIYHSTHQFKQAAVYYSKAVQIDPKSVALRTRLAISLYRSGDVDGAIAQLNSALSYDPKDANSLFDLGMIRLQGKQDSKGALAAWRQLLKTNPQLSPDRKAAVQRMMADAQTTAGDSHATKGDQSQ